MDGYDVVIVGTGHAGAQAAIALRQRKFAGTIAMIGEEPEWPYERPSLSKDYLAGDRSFERILIRPSGFWHDRAIAIHAGRRVTGVDPSARTVRTQDGMAIGYRTLVWAAGGAARRLTCDGGTLAGIHTVRTRADADRLRGELDRTRQVAVIGGGYIGLEAAAVLAKLGKQVTVLEAMPRVLARVAGEELSRFYTAEHRAHGVDVRPDSAVSCIEGDAGRIAGVRLDNGELFPADMAIVGIGITPAVAPLIAAGATGVDGIDVDAFCRSSLPDVYAIGDCAMHANRFAGGTRVRIESVQNATDQAITAASAICGDPSPYDAVPWFWSNQYDLKLQTVGLSIGHDDHVVRGDIASRSFSIVYLRGGRVIALDCVNAVKDYVQGRALVLAGSAPPRAQLADTGVALKDLVVAA